MMIFNLYTYVYIQKVLFIGDDKYYIRELEIIDYITRT